MLSRRQFVQTVPAAGFAAQALWAQTPVTAKTAFGNVRGIERGGIKIFKGIPYGASTTGANRFTPPKDPAAWSGVKDALEYGHSAPQTNPTAARTNGGLSVAAAGLPAEGEDCLVLNVWTPAIADGRPRPVMFWCHGGGFATGSGSSPITEGENLARRGDAVVVTINHRLNVLGFANLAEFHGDFLGSGDAGMLDIVHALKWVKTNIAEFGGDANNVTIFGQSGGGRKVETLLAMPSAKGLFHRAIIESGASMQLVPRDVALRVGGRLLDRLGISKSNAKEIQNVPLERIMGAYFAVLADSPSVDQMTAGFSPTMDGELVAQHPFAPTAATVSANVPVMIGSTRTELTLTYQNDPAMFSLEESALRPRLAKEIGQDNPKLIDVYRKANPGASPSDFFFLIASDYRYGAPTMKIAERRAALNKGSVYLYYFTWETPALGGRLKSPHTIEIPFAFDNVKAAERLTGGGAVAQALAERVSSTWLAFARTGNPNNPKMPQWPAYNAKDRATMVMNNECKVVKDPIRQQRLAMFDAMKMS